MKTRGSTHWLAAVAGGLLLVVPVLGWAASPWGQGGVPSALEACEAELAACEAEPCSIFPGDGQTGAPLIYTDNGDETFTDDNTGLMWEIKTGTVGDPVECSEENFPVPQCLFVADVNNRWTWTADAGGTQPDGTAFEFFLVMRNQTCGGETYGPLCASDADCASAAIHYCGLGGHTDWRLPTVKELQSLVDYSTRVPATSFPGEVANSYYWSSTSNADGEGHAWYVYFYDGNVGRFGKDGDFHVSAVRGGR